MSEQAKGLTPNLAVSRVPARMPGWVEGASGAGSGGGAADSSLFCSYRQEGNK